MVNDKNGNIFMKRNYIQPAMQVTNIHSLSVLMASGGPFNINTNTSTPMDFINGGANAGTGV
jgi:hypothetical protein